MQFLRTALVSAVLGVSMSSFAAVSDTAAADPDAREARMQEALQNYYAKQEAMNQGTTAPKSMHHAKHHRHAMKHTTKKAQDESATAKDKDKDKTQ